MELLMLACWSFVGSYLWMFNPEIGVIIAASKLPYHPVLLGCITGASQTAGYLVGYFFADLICARFPGIRRKVQRFDIKRLGHASWGLVATSGVFGLPPLSVVSIGGGLYRFSPLRLFAIALVGRMLRFSLLASFPDVFRQLLSGVW